MTPALICILTLEEYETFLRHQLEPQAVLLQNQANLICATPAKQSSFNIIHKMERQLMTDSNVEDLLLLNQPDCEANQAKPDLKPVAKQAPASAGGQH